VCIASAKEIVANKATVTAMVIAVDIFAANLPKKMSLYKTFVSSSLSQHSSKLKCLPLARLNRLF
jgi:hypothetical protein